MYRCTIACFNSNVPDTQARCPTCRHPIVGVARYGRILNILNARNAQQKFIVSQRVGAGLLRKSLARESDRVGLILGEVDGGKGDEDNRLRAEKACATLKALLLRVERFVSMCACVSLCMSENVCAHVCVCVSVNAFNNLSLKTCDVPKYLRQPRIPAP
jgi:hypothetical protein